MIMPSGKYKGKELNEVPHGYLIWMYDRKKLSADLKKWVEENVPIIKFQKEMKNKV